MRTRTRVTWNGSRFRTKNERFYICTVQDLLLPNCLTRLKLTTMTYYSIILCPLSHWFYSFTNHHFCNYFILCYRFNLLLMDRNIALYNLICFLEISIQFDIDDYPSSKIRFHDTNILIVTKILISNFSKQNASSVLYFFHNFLFTIIHNLVYCSPSSV